MNWLAARIVAAVTVLAAVAVLFAPRAVALPAALLLAFALPGFALTEVIFRGRALSAVERTVLAPALSLGTLVVCGLVVHASGVPLDRLSWTVSSAAVTLVALIVWTALSRPVSLREVVLVTPRAEPVPAAETRLIPVVRDEEPPPVPEPLRMAGEQARLARERVQEAQARAERRRRQRRVFAEFLPLLLVLAVLGGAGRLSLRSSHDAADVTVTTLSAEPPGPVDTAGDRVVAVSATGLVPADGPYAVVVTGNDNTTDERRTVEVPAGGTWQARLTVPGGERVMVSLYRAGDTTAYRTLYIAPATG